MRYIEKFLLIKNDCKTDELLKLQEDVEEFLNFLENENQEKLFM